MKKSKLLAVFLAMTFMVACTKPTAVTDETAGDDIDKNDIIENNTVSDTQSGESASQDGASDYEHQLEIIAEQYENWIIGIEDWKFNPDESVSKDDDKYMIAVTDLNRNGRLELMCSSIQGSGLFAVTYMYEINDSCTNLNRFSTNRDDATDHGADFILNPVMNCYEKDGIYYYALDDYIPTGARLIEEYLYVYSFDGGIQQEKIGGYQLNTVEFDYDNWCAKSVSVKFCDATRGYLDDDKALNKLIDDSLAGYNKLPCVNVKWVDAPDEDNCLESLKSSFEGYDENSTQTVELIPDYKSFHADTTEYTIRTPQN